MTTSLLADAFGHHVWATTTLIDACLPLTAEQLATTVPGTYGSILDTMRHTVGADCGYLFALTGGRVPEIDEDSMDLAQLRAVMVRNQDHWTAFLDQDLDPNVTVTRHREDGPRATPQWASDWPRCSTTGPTIEARSARL